MPNDYIRRMQEENRRNAEERDRRQELIDAPYRTYGYYEPNSASRGSGGSGGGGVVVVLLLIGLVIAGFAIFGGGGSSETSTEPLMVDELSLVEFVKSSLPQGSEVSCPPLEGRAGAATYCDAIIAGEEQWESWSVRVEMVPTGDGRVHAESAPPVRNE